jgi:hypothetical protein
VATFEVFPPPSPRLHTRPGPSERTVSDTPGALATCLTNSPSFLNRYFCEPAYEKFRGTNEGALNSRLYNEKAYVLSRGFILRALEKPPNSLEDEIRGFYLSSLFPEGGDTEDAMDQDQGCGESSSQGRAVGGQRRLEKVLKNSEDLISLSQALQQRSQSQPLTLGQSQPPADLEGPQPVVDEDAAVPSLTAGGILTLQRALAKLSNIQRNSSQRSLETVSMSN